MSTSEAPMVWEQDEVGEANKPWPIGDYPCKLLDVQVQEAPGRDPSLLAIFEVTSGPKAGEDMRIYRSLAAYANGKGGWFAPGLMEIKADLKAADGIAPGEKMTREAAQARVQYAKGLARKELNVRIYEDSYVAKKDNPAKEIKAGDTVKQLKKRITGIVGGSSAGMSVDGLA